MWRLESITVQDQQMQEFIQLLVAGQSRIYAYIMTMVANRNDADDIMQETTSMMWQRFGTFETGTDIVAWGIAIARYRILEFRRKKKKDSKVQFSDRTFKELEKESQTRLRDIDEYVSALRTCVQKLTSRDKALVNLKYEQSLAVKDISMRIGKTVQNVYYHLSRIHTLLLSCVQKTIEARG